MIKELQSFIIPVKDVTKAKELYSAFLGKEPYVDEAYYVGYKVGDLDVGLDPNGHQQGITMPVAYWRVDDIKQSVQELVSAGAELQQEARVVGGGMLIARVRDADGNIVGLAQTP